MSKIVIIGAGAMGSAFALPCLDNNHDINIVGTHLESDFIDQLKKNDNLHQGLNTKIPKEIKIFKFEKFDELLKSNVMVEVPCSNQGRRTIYTHSNFTFCRILFSLFTRYGERSLSKSSTSTEY